LETGPTSTPRVDKYPCASARFLANRMGGLPGLLFGRAVPTISTRYTTTESAEYPNSKLASSTWADEYESPSFSEYHSWAATTLGTSTTTSPADENIFFVQNIMIVSPIPEAIVPHAFCSLAVEEQPVRYQ